MYLYLVYQSIYLTNSFVLSTRVSTIPIFVLSTLCYIDCMRTYVVTPVVVYICPRFFFDILSTCRGGGSGVCNGMYVLAIV